MLRRAWERLVRKQWLILYPLALGIINAIAFFAVYAARGSSLSWDAFFRADFDRWSYVHDHLVSGFAWTPALAVAVFAGLAVCGLAAMIRAPFFRAIVGMGYPLAPRNKREPVHLFLLYVLTNLILWVLPMVTPDVGGVREFAAFASYVIAILIVFADYVIVYEQASIVESLRRSVRLLGRRWIVVVLVFLVAQLAYYALYRLYDSYYSTAEGIFVLLPVSRILVEAFVVLIVDLVLIFTYHQLRRSTPA